MDTVPTEQQYPRKTDLANVERHARVLWDDAAHVLRIEQRLYRLYHRDLAAVNEAGT